MRARIKSVAELSPDYAQHCCASALAAGRRNEGLIIELVGAPEPAVPWRCDNCGAQGEEAHYRVVGPKFGWVGVGCVDIEEGS